VAEFFYKAIFPTVNDLWMSNLRKADVSSWILIDSTGIVDVIKILYLSRSEFYKTSLLLQSFDFATLYTKIDLKASMKVLINNLFHQTLKLHCFKFLSV
jgi:hypothetical protein